MLAAEVETLRRQWETWSREGQRLATTLGRVQAAERQVHESLEALRPDMAELTRVEEELAAGKDTEDLRRQCRELLVSYARLCAEAQQPAAADYRRLREEGLAQLHEQLAFFRLTYQQTVEEARAALKRPLTELWERWEPLSERISRAIPPSQTDHQTLTRRWETLVRASRSNLTQLGQVLALQAEIETFGHDLNRLEADFGEEREQIHLAEVELARERRSALQLRECLPSLLTHSHPQIVDEEWERSTRAWRKGEGLVRRLEPRRNLQGYLERLEEAATAYREARERARSAMVRLLRYALLEDPEGMHQACLPMGSGWSRLGMTSRETHIRDLLAELEQGGQAGQLGRLAERISSYFLRRSGAS
jgi:predicted  nucleic acid-binding Zn-ribbon protein